VTTFHHKNIRLGKESYKGQRWHFATICCHQRRPVFSSQLYANRLIEILRRDAISHRFGVHAYCVMPDHLHLLVQGLDHASDLLTFIKSLKQSTGYEFKQADGNALWQKKFHDHILRARDSVDAVAAYIWLNPVRKGLCTEPKKYPYSGSLLLDWSTVRLTEAGWEPPWKTKAPA
jgi:putative transposase